ncbi:hypothetical protein AKJ39_03950 [candidate division MSBL1 archaeon SCGC-AAA259J03]|uniref:PIN domain-containing protein n=1 Tax=candidate division MSBL1 archaeon SCGC-AAA259J03 TaxID=1698269 RepID=A0A656YVA6_9EURY|nr:hypothetical protein AKJ39_03950 [candidate division MSBL1 archaeon SCGC-AAA259J03]
MEAVEKLVVPDASVIDKWFVEEEYTEEALNLREDYIARRTEIIAPELLPFEVLNSLRYNPEYQEQDLLKVSEALDDYSFWLHRLKGDVGKNAVRKAVKYDITIYDASYVSLGEEKGAEVYTADGKLLEKLDTLDNLHHISKYR